ncbi:MAG: adenosylcobinamide-phosphate synthase CbiB [Chloroflexota bacterium]
MLLLALLIDIALGDPPNQVHPVAWMGRAIGAMQARAPQTGRALPLLYGGVIAWGGALLMWVAVRMVDQLTHRRRFGWVLAAVILKQTFALRGLDRAAASVESALRDGDLDEARRLLSWHMVSRDTSTLSPSLCAAAAIESVTENTSDGFVAPLFFYVVAGLPGAYAYRWVQTCDSMLGYRDPAREWLGKVPARTDDLLNLIPARLTALAMIVGSRNPMRAWAIWRLDATQTASPNAGHPMSAAAGALGVELEKQGHYALGAGQRPPDPDDLRAARYLMWRSVGLSCVGLMALRLLRGRRHAKGGA